MTGMRRILFRGKSSNDEEWVYGDLLHNGIDYDTAIYCEKTKTVNEVYPETVGQYTGLTDKNGERIFEGDIVTAYNAIGECTHTATAVKWNDFFAEWSIGKCNSMYSDGSICSYEVIGNIHDNPELIGGGEDA